MNHDERFKALLRRHFALVLDLIHPPYAGAVDLATLQWLDKELITAPPERRVQLADMVAKAAARAPIPAFRPGEEPFNEVIFHLEIEANDRLTHLRPRLFSYNSDLKTTYSLPVISLAVYLRVGLDGRGVDTYEETIFDETHLRFQWRYLGLPALDAEEYVQGDNWLGVALSALMRIAPDRRAWLAAEAMRRLLEAPLGREDKLLLCECVQAYLPLTGEQRVAFNQLMIRESYQGVKLVVKSWFEEFKEVGIEEGKKEGLKEGLKEGRAKGHRELLHRMLEKRFGPLSEQARAELEGWPIERLEDAGLRLLDAKSIEELGLPNGTTH